MTDPVAQQSVSGVVSLSGPLPAPQPCTPPPDRVVAGAPVQQAYNCFSSADGRFHCGLWESAVGKWRVQFTENEFCQLLAGVLVVTGEDGVSRTFRAGDAFVTPAGFTGWWEVVEPARKYYALYE